MIFAQVVVVAIVLLVVAMQFWLVRQIRRTMPDQERTWIVWCRTHVAAAVVEQNRRDRFEASVHSTREYQALRRLGLSAPLIGVVMTACLVFIQSNVVDKSEQVVAGVQLIFMGVLAGAAIALLNQCLQWYVDQVFQSRLLKAEEQMSAEMATLTATAPESNFSLSERLDRLFEDVALRATATSETLASAIEASTRQLQQRLDVALKRLVEKIDEAASGQEAFARAVDVARGNSVATNQRLADLTTALERTAERLPELGDQFGSILTGTADLRSRLELTVDELLSEAAALQEANRRITTETARQTERTTNELMKRMKGLEEPLSTLSEGIHRMSASLDETSAHLKRSTEAVAQALEGGSKQLSAGASGIRTAADRIEEASNRLTGPTVQRLDDSIGKLAASNRQHMEAASASAASLTNGAAAIERGLLQAARTIEKMDAASSGLDGSLQQLHAAMRSLVEASAAQEKKLDLWPEMARTLLAHFESELKRVIGEVGDDLSGLIGQAVEVAAKIQPEQEGTTNGTTTKLPPR